MRHRPKKWDPPKSWRARYARDLEATGWGYAEVSARIIKHTWPETGETPKWAKLAYERHWITMIELFLIPLDPTPHWTELMYEESPLFKMLKKSDAFKPAPKKEREPSFFGDHFD
jgi:hypothetical protein